MADSEPLRLDTLRLYKILDTANEQAFDDLTRLAATICGVPISLVSLVDENRQWFKSHYGLTTTETPRDQAFCAYAIEGHDVMIVEDAKTDARFANNELVTAEPNIRFYAGAPLVVESGITLGTLCVIDREPRRLSANQLDALGVLRDAVVAQMKLRRTLHELKTLESLIPMCAWCRNVRVNTDSSEADSWQPLYEYVASTSPMTHGICPDCAQRMREEHTTDQQ